jgi:hypothetical protein
MCSVRMPEEEDPSSLLALFSARGLASWFMLLEVQLEASLPASVVITFCTLLSVSVALAPPGVRKGGRLQIRSRRCALGASWDNWVCSPSNFA